MKVELAIYIMGYLFAGFQPIIAEATGAMEPLPWWGQLGVCGMIGFLHWWTIGKTIPEMNKTNKEGMTDLAAEVRGMRDDFNTASEHQILLLSEAIKNRKE